MRPFRRPIVTHMFTFTKQEAGVRGRMMESELDFELGFLACSRVMGCQV